MNRSSSFPIALDAGNALSDRAVAVRIDRARWTALLLFLTFVGVAIGVPLAGWPIRDGMADITMLFFTRQDLPLLPLALIPLLLRMNQQSGTEPMAIRFGHAKSPFYLAFAIVLFGWWGHYAVLSGWNYSRDEQMADFDAAIFSHARLFWPIPAEWRPFANALNQTFILPIGNHEAWVSGYLPVNAAFRALIGMVADPALTSPFFVALGAVSLSRISFRLFRESASSRTVALLLYAGSSQIWLMGMTSYAMSAHLGLNLFWLALFLRGDWRGHAGAMAIGWFGTGLHQPLFHPLFALPFMGLLWRNRQWRQLAAYGTAYIAIGLFWMAWPIWIHAHGGAVPGPVSVDYVARLRETLNVFSMTSAWLMSSNLLRFILWQHMMLVPLLAIGIATSWNKNPIVLALGVSFGLPILVMAFLLPQQGHGWGYRYLHGVIGNACLLGGYGWQWLDANGRAPRRTLLATSLATLFVIIPVHAWMAHETVLAAATANRRIATLPAAIAIIDDQAAPFAKDIVLNRPDLSNRPIRLNGSALDPASIPRLCRLGTLAFVDGPSLGALDQLYGLPARTDATPHQRALEDAARAGGCGASKLPDPAANRGRADP